jgi:hypothetical protein
MSSDRSHQPSTNDPDAKTDMNATKEWKECHTSNPVPTGYGRIADEKHSAECPREKSKQKPLQASQI